MASQLINPLTRAIADDFPFPIRFVFREAVVDAPDEERRVRGIIQTFTTGIQYAALICASEYARAPYREEHLSWSLGRLKRPLISDFFHFITAATASLKEHGVSPLAPEVGAFSSQMEETLVTIPVMVDDSPRERPLLLSTALMELRNTLGHKLYQANWALLAEQYLPSLLLFLRSMEWCARYPLFRLVGDGRMERLMGESPPHMTEPIPEAAKKELARAHEEGELSGLMLADPTLSRFLNLYPLILIAPCEECRAGPLGGLTEEVFLFNGDEGRYVTYLGVRHRRNTVSRAGIDALYDSKKIRPPVIRVNQITPKELSRRALRQSEQLLAANISARRYLPQVYHRRPEMEAALQGFVRGRRAGFCLLGEAGIGKTSLLCRKLEEWSGRLAGGGEGEETPREVVLFYEGKGLFAGGSLEERVMNDLYLEGSFQELLNRVRPTGRRLIIIVDGVNDDEEPSRTLLSLCQFITRYAPPAAQLNERPPLQVVFSFRSAFFDKALRALKYAGDGDETRDLLPQHVFFTREVEQLGQKQQTYRFVVGRMSEAEAGLVYETYRAFEGLPDDAQGKPRHFRPLTPFNELLSPTRRLLTHPWYLRMVMESFDGRQVPPSLWVGELLREFCLIKIYGKTEGQRLLFHDRAAFADELVSLMRRKRAGTVERGDMAASPLLWGALEERQTPLSAYLQLLDEGVLMETAETKTIGSITRTRQSVRFAFDTLFEYLLAQNILRVVDGWENLTGARLASLIEESEDFGHLYGAVELLLAEAAQQGDDALVADALAAAGRAAVPLFIRVLDTVEGLRPERFAPLLDLIAANKNAEHALMILIDASRRFGEKLRLGAMLACAVRAEAVGRNLTEEMRAGLIHALATALLNKGAALNKLGRLPEAIESYDEAIAIYRPLVQEQGQFDLAGKMAMVLMNRGVALFRLQRLPEAFAGYEEAIAILRWIVEDKGVAELLSQLAMTLQNRATLLQKLGLLSKAIDGCDEVIGIYKRLVEEGRTELLSELARAFTNKGISLRGLGRFGEALACYDEAIAIYRPLVEEQGASELAGDLAAPLMNRGVALFMSGRAPEAVSVCKEAVTIYRRLVEEKGLADFASGLALALMNEAAALILARRPPEAVGRCGEAVAIYERLVGEEQRPEFSHDLAKAQMVRGNAFMYSGRLREALDSHDEAVANYRLLMEEQGRTELAGDLAMALVNKAMALARSFRLPEAVDCFDDAVAIYAWLIEDHGRLQLANEMATALLEKGSALGHSGNYPEAIACTDEAIAILKRLVEEQGRSEMVFLLADALMGRARSLSSSYRWPEALEGFQEALVIWRSLVREQGRDEYSPELTLALIAKGTTLITLNRLPESLESFDEAIALGKSLVEGRGAPEHVNILALALANKGTALDSSGRPGEAADICFEAADLCRRVLRGQWHLAVANTLAVASVNRGNALFRCGRLPEAIGSYDEGVAVYRSLIQEHGLTTLADDLAAALTSRGAAYNSSAAFDKAASDCGEAVVIYQKLMGEGRQELLEGLAKALSNAGLAANSLGRFADAQESCDQAVSAYALLINAGRTDLLAALAANQLNKSTALWGLTRMQEALSSCDKAIVIYRHLLAEQGTPGHAVSLASALLVRGVGFNEIDRFPEALASLDEAVDVLGRLTAAGMTSLTPELFKTYIARFNLLTRMSDWRAAAADVRLILALARPSPSASLPEPMADQWAYFLDQLDELDGEELTQLCGELGEAAEVVRSLVERGGR